MPEIISSINFLIVTPFTWPETAGTGINAFNFCKYLYHKSIPFTLLTFNRNLIYKKNEVIDNIEIIRIPYFNKSQIHRLISLPLVVINYLRYILNSKCIIIYGGKIIGFEFIILLCKILNKKVIFQSQLMDIDDIRTLVISRPCMIRSFYKALFRNINIYFSINNEFSNTYKIIYKDDSKILQIPQGVDTNKFKPVTSIEKNRLRKKLNLPINKFIIFSAGFLIGRKGYEKIIEYLKDLKIPFLYLIAGEISLNKNHFLSEFNSETQNILIKGKSTLTENIQFLGYKFNIHEYIQASDILLHNAYQEGLPNIILEAMACGIAVITRKIKGLDNFILYNKKNVLVFENENEMVDQIHYLQSNPKLRLNLGSNARQYALENCSFDKVFLELTRALNC